MLNINGRTAVQYCQLCGAELPAQAQFCGRCGYPFDTTIPIVTVMNMMQSSLDTQPPDVSPAGSRISVLGHKVLGKLPIPVQREIHVVLTRARDPEPEVSHAIPQEVVESQAITWGWLPMLALTSSLGVFSVAHAYTGASGAEFFFWLGLLLIFVPAMVRLITPRASRFERIGLLCVVGICFYLVNVMLSPLHFSSYDEFLHWRTAVDIARSGHLFSENTLLPVSPFYPGLEIVTNSLSRLSGLSTFASGVVVIAVARLVMILSLFMLYELITKSARIAGIATILYVTNPHFIFFDAQFAYESLALPLATFMLFVVARQETMISDHPWTMLAAWIALGAVVVTHHITSFFFVGFLILWTVIYLLQHSAHLHHLNLTKTALFGIFITLAWMSLPGNPVVAYLSSYLKDALGELGQTLMSHSSGQQLLTVYSGQPTPLWERTMALTSVALILLCFPFGLLCLLPPNSYNKLVGTLGIVSLAYPISYIFQLTNFGSEISDRAAAFLFIPIACLLAIFIAQFWPTRRLYWKRTSLIAFAISIVFLGQFILGNTPVSQLLPGPYLVSADNRSIEPEGIQAAIWAGSYLGSDNHIATDRINQLLMSTFGDQHIVTPSGDNIDVTDVFFSPTLDSYEISLLQRSKVRYLIVDLRLSKGLPRVGFYFEQGEPGYLQRNTPIGVKALTKFNTVPQINRVFDSGDIVIYDVGGLTNAP